MTIPKPVRVKKEPKPLKRYPIRPAAKKTRPAKGTTKLPARKTIPQLEHALDALTSKIVRYSRLVPTISAEGWVQCYTCGHLRDVKNTDCGHFISRGEKRTRYHFDNLRPQCVKCNQHLHGQPHRFREHLVQEIGRERVEALEALAADRTPWMGYREYLEAEIPVRKAMLKELEARIR